ncbi:MAG: DUF2384 domain-containing protein [Elusimicrobia bacterium]|nr:DUF2384 domain-containing protein [Elusimicrobiota bacterium]
MALEKALKKRILTLVRALDLAYELLGKDEEKAAAWVMAPNDVFSDDSPFEVIMQGNGNHVIDFLLERAGKKAGAAF